MGKQIKVVYWDLETLPNLNAALNVWTQLSDYPGRTLKADICSIICFGYKINNSPAKVINAWDFPKHWNKDINDDYEVVKAAYEILHDADVVVTHNGKRFDLGFLNTRIMYHRVRTDPTLSLLPKIAHVDTCQVAKRNLFLFNNRLGNLGKFLNQGVKMDTGGWELWVKVHGRCQKSMDKMSRYCKRDVSLTASIFQEVKSVANDLPNMNLFSKSKKPVCPRCKSARLQCRGKRVRKTKRVQTYQCQSCGHWSQDDKIKVKPL